MAHCIQTHSWQRQLRLEPLRGWLGQRPPECPARACVQAVLAQATGPLRVGLCLLSGEPVAGVDPQLVPVRWPVVCTGVDVVVLVHPGELGARMRARMAAGPMFFAQCRSLEEVSGLVERLRSAPDAGVVAARWRLTVGELEVVAARFPEVAGSLRECMAECGPLERGPVEHGEQEQVAVKQAPVIAVIGPDAATREPVAQRLAESWRVADAPRPTVDAVVVVAPSGGWSAADAAPIADAFAQVGRVVCVGELPTAAPPGVCAAPLEALEEELRGVVARPPAAVVPAPEYLRWMGAAERADQRARERLRLELGGARRLVGRRYAAVRERLEQLCEVYGIAVPSARPPARVFAQVLLVAIAGGVGVFRVVALLAGVGAAAVCAVGCGVVCGGVRLWVSWVGQRRHWCALVISNLSDFAELDSTSYRQRGFSAGGQWVRLRLSRLEKTTKNKGVM